MQRFLGALWKRQTPERIPNVNFDIFPKRKIESWNGHQRIDSSWSIRSHKRNIISNQQENICFDPYKKRILYCSIVYSNSNTVFYSTAVAREKKPLCFALRIQYSTCTVHYITFSFSLNNCTIFERESESLTRAAAHLRHASVFVIILRFPVPNLILSRNSLALLSRGINLLVVDLLIFWYVDFTHTNYRYIEQ